MGREIKGRPMGWIRGRDGIFSRLGLEKEGHVGYIRIQKKKLKEEGG